MAKKLMGKREVRSVVGFSDSTFGRLERKQLFPKRVKIPGSRRAMYLEEEILQYVEDLRARRDAESSQAIPYTKTWRASR